MPRPVRFAFAHGVPGAELELRLGYAVFKHRAHGVGDGELAQFLTRDVADEGLLVEPAMGDERDPEDGPIVLLVRRAAPDHRA